MTLPAGSAVAPAFPSDRLRRAAESFVIPVGALVVAMILFGVFMALIGKNPLEVYALIYKGGFSSAFAWQNTLQRAAPLILTALCVALPAQAGLIIIGGEGALVLGGLAAAVVGHAAAGASPLVAQVGMALIAMIAGGTWIAFAGALRHYRGVNETISSLLLTYIAIALFNHFVEGPLRDPASLNKPSTQPIGEAVMVGHLPGMDVHWGLAYGLVFCAAVLRARALHRSRVRLEDRRRQRARGAARWPARGLAGSGELFRRRLGCGARRHGGGRRGSRQRQRVAHRGLWLCRDPGFLYRAAQPASP